jgi:hypothetical protein
VIPTVLALVRLEARDSHVPFVSLLYPCWLKHVAIVRFGLDFPKAEIPTQGAVASLVPPSDSL